MQAFNIAVDLSNTVLEVVQKCGIYHNYTNPAKKAIQQDT